MVNWEIEILNINGTPKIAYNNNNPGGIVSSINFDVEPSGNCLTASFQGIPNKLDIAPRDFVRIKVGGVNKFYGYLVNHFNQNASEVVTYNIEGAKSLLYDHIISGVHWFRGVPNIGDGEDKLVDHRQVVTSLQSELPYYVSSTFDNQASLLTGSGVPVIYAFKTLGEVLDGIVAASREGAYVWGVDANRKVFVRPAPDNAINLDPLKKRIKYRSQNTDKIVTSVIFQFTVPTSYLGDGMDRQRQTFTDTAELHVPSGRYKTDVKDEYEGAIITHEYTDDALAAQYGTFTQKVPLVLSESWMKVQSLTEWEDENTYEFSPGWRSASLMVYTNVLEPTWETNSGLTDPADLRAAIESPSGFLRNRNNPLGGGADLSLHATRGGGSTYPNVNLPDNILGVIWDYEIDQTTDFKIRVYRWYHYRNMYSPVPRIANSPLQDFEMYSTTNGIEEDNTLGKIRLIHHKRGLRDWGTSPNQVDGNGNPLTAVDRIIHHFSVYPFFPFGTTPVELPANLVRIHNIKLLVLNEELLDEYAKSFMKTPATDPSEVTVTQDLGLAASATLNGNPGNPIVRIKTAISRADGFAVTYVIGDDADRNNQALNRLFDRDTRATLQAVDVATGRG